MQNKEDVKNSKEKVSHCNELAIRQKNSLTNLDEWVTNHFKTTIFKLEDNRNPGQQFFLSIPSIACDAKQHLMRDGLSHAILPPKVNSSSGLSGVTQ